MDAETVRAKMCAQLDQARLSGIARACGWEFETQELAAYITLVPRRQRDRRFLIRLTFEEFPMRAPSYVFVQPETKQSAPEAWPPGVMHSEEAICTPGTREFHERLHKNDAEHPWDADRYTVLDTLHRIQQLMEKGLGG